MAIPSEFLTATFVLVCHGDGACASIVHGWNALCAAWIDAHVHEPDERMAAEVLSPLLNLGDWTRDFDGLPYHYSARYEDGAVEVIRITEKADLGLNALDAARYRWLRSRDLDTITRGGVFAGVTPDNLVINGEDLDRHIDREREEETCRARGEANRDRLHAAQSVYEAAERRAKAAGKESGDAEKT